MVDGQQRLRTLFEYIDQTEAWVFRPPTKIRQSGFKSYRDLSSVQQMRVDEYKVAVALLREYEVPDILDVYSRLQTGKPLKIGERIKALRSGFKEYLRELANHRLFELDQHRFRDSNWNLAAQFFKASYTGNPVARVEFAELKDFLLGPVDDSKAQKAKDRANRVMTFELKTINEALTARPSFEEYLSSARTLKWLFAALSQLIDCYSLTGKEHLVARGVLEYYDAKARESSPEWTSYFGAGRTGRMDTDDVKACLNQLSQYMVNSANAHPLDTNRWFTAEQRDQIWHTSGESCRICHIKLSRSNFHADHIQPHSEGGRTTVENGQALCAACNLRKGRDTMFPSELR